MRVFAKLRAPLWGRGQVKVEFTRSFEVMSEADKMAVLNQVMRVMRDAHDQAAAREKFRLAGEDAENARRIRRRGEVAGGP